MAPATDSSRGLKVAFAVTAFVLAFAFVLWLLTQHWPGSSHHHATHHAARHEHVGGSVHEVVVGGVRTSGKPGTGSTRVFTYTGSGDPATAPTTH